MVRFLLMLIVFIFISTGCQSNPGNGSQQNQEDGQRKSEPIPVNPQHS